MNSNNNNWKQKALTPVVLKETDDSFSTVSDLMNAIEKDEILNIAVTGPYGSGKSSVIKTFKEMKNSITGDAKTSTGLLSFVSKIFK